MGNSLVDFASDALGVLERISEVARAPRPSPSGKSRIRSTTGSRPRAAEFSVVEAIDADTGREVFVVSNRRGDSATCSSAAFAARVRDSLG